MSVPIPYNTPKKSTIEIGAHYGIDREKMWKEAEKQRKYIEEGRDSDGLNYAQRAARNMDIAIKNQENKMFGRGGNRIPAGHADEPVATAFSRLRQQAFEVSQKQEPGPYSPSSAPIQKVECPVCHELAFKQDKKYFMHHYEDTDTYLTHLYFP